MRIAKKLSTILLLLIFISGITLSMEGSRHPKGQTTIELICQRKMQEATNNKNFVVAAESSKWQKIRSTWSNLGESSVCQIQGAKLCPEKTITISGVELKAHDLTGCDYRFHIHTTAITETKAKLLHRYILSQREVGEQRHGVQGRF